MVGPEPGLVVIGKRGRDAGQTGKEESDGQARMQSCWDGKRPDRWANSFEFHVEPLVLPPADVAEVPGTVGPSCYSRANAT
jgi:hypothetical protein